MKHIVFCSQTGGEIVRISKALGRVPNVLVSNNISALSVETINWIVENNVSLIELPRNPKEEDYDALPLKKDDLITLHGFLRILPKGFCEKFTIYNGHPGLITEYLELKGKDPQLKVWGDKDRYPVIGTVIHKVTAEVDEGKIILFNSQVNKVESLDELFSVLQNLSLGLWVDFLTNKIKWD